jgi:hypothetical protein
MSVGGSMQAVPVSAHEAGGKSAKKACERMRETDCVEKLEQMTLPVRCYCRTCCSPFLICSREVKVYGKVGVEKQEWMYSMKE